jgi:hypothetical protein
MRKSGHSTTSSGIGAIDMLSAVGGFLSALDGAAQPARCAYADGTPTLVAAARGLKAKRLLPPVAVV